MDEKKAGLTKIVGDKSVFENPKPGELFSSGFDPIPPVRPRFKVKPRTADDVQKIVHWANRTQTGDCTMGPIGGQGGGGTGLWENFTCFDCHDKASTEGTLEFFNACTEFSKQKGWIGTGMEKWNQTARGSNGRTTLKEERDKMHLSAPQPSVFRYQHKIREAFNPNDLGDAYYETLEDS